MRISLVPTEAKPATRGKTRVSKKQVRKFRAAVAWPQRQPHSRTASPRRSRAQQAHAAPEPAQPRVRLRDTDLGRRILARWWVLPIVAALIAGAVYLSVDAKFFIYDAQIVGARHIAAEAVYQAAGIDQQSIFWIRPAQVADRIREIDGVKSARVRRGLPAAVRIEVVEREPILMWRASAQDRDWWVDDEGMILPYHGDTEAKGMLFVVDYSDRQLKVGERLTPEGIVGSVKALAAAMPGTQVFNYDQGRGLSYLQELDGRRWPVYVGTVSDLALKLEAARSLVGYIQAKSIAPDYVDVRWPDRPVVGMPGAGGSN